jgi:hypothetical protein
MLKTGQNFVKKLKPLGQMLLNSTCHAHMGWVNQAWGWHVVR